MNSRKVKVPKIGTKIISSLTKPDDRTSLNGDLEEVYLNIHREKGKIRAGLWFWFQVVQSLPQILTYSFYRSIGMFKNYLKIAFRNIRKHKGYSLINISSLTVGLACCILMLLWVQDELSYDGYHENSENIYRVVTKNYNPNGFTLEAMTPVPIGPVLKDRFPEVVNATRFFNLENGGWLLTYEDKSFDKDRLGTGDPSIFELFSFEFVSGDPNTAFSDIYAMVISEELSKKYYGDENPLGKTITVHRRPFKITGVIKNIPGNSHMQFDYIFPTSFWNDAWGMDLNNWKDTGWYNFIQLRENTDVEQLTLKIKNIIKEHNPESNAEVFLQPLTDIHLEPQYVQGITGISDIKYVYIFSLTAFLILIIACINFMNLATARSSNRAKEIGMRKVTGAFRSDLILQFLGESMLFALIASILAVIMSVVSLPVFNQLSGKELTLDLFNNAQIFSGLVIITTLGGIFAGSYPALMLSSLNPVNVLKGTAKRSGMLGKLLRRSLVTAQFAFTIILIIGSIVIYRQIDYINTKDLGFSKDNIVSFVGRGMFGRDFENARNELLQNPDIYSVSKSITPTELGRGTSDVSWEGKSDAADIQFYFTHVDEYYLETFDIELVEGRYFSNELISDTANYVLNQKAVSMLGFDSPLGKRFSFQGRDGEIIGVVKDYHLGSLHNEIVPLFHKISPNAFPFINVKFNPDNLDGTVDFLQSKWKEYVSAYPFAYNFLDEKINNFYKADRLTSEVFKYFTFLAIFISCLGLFGMASFTAERKTKEIGVRKVLGATVPSIIGLISREFIRIVFAAMVFALPAGWYLSNSWLQNFAYRTEVGIEIPVISGLTAVFIAFAAISYQAVKAAKADPVDSLKYE